MSFTGRSGHFACAKAAGAKAKHVTASAASKSPRAICAQLDFFCVIVRPSTFAAFF
jgi:hypothetical protein